MSKNDPPVPEAERRKQALQRRRQVRERTGSATPPSPRSVRVDPRPLLVAGRDTGVYEPLLVPDRALKDTTGRYAFRALVVQLDQALGVHVLVALHGLQAALGTRVAAENALIALGLPSLKNLLRDGRRRLRQATLFDTEAELRSFSVRKVEAHKRSSGPQQLWHPSAYADMELSAVKLINLARLRAQGLLSVFEDIQRRHVGTARPGSSGEAASTEDVVGKIDAESHDAIQAAFDRHSGSIHLGQMWELAAYADVNPVILWPQHIQRFAGPLEVARFIGRVDHGVEARLDTAHVLLVAAILNRSWGPFDDDRDHLADVTRTKLTHHFKIEALLDCLGQAEQTGSDLISTRGTRTLALNSPPRS